jgi:hypothetical protein
MPAKTLRQTAQVSIERMAVAVREYAMAFARDCVLVTLCDLRRETGNPSVEEILLQIQRQFGQQIPRRNLAAYARDARRRLANNSTEEEKSHVKNGKEEENPPYSPRHEVSSGSG